MCVCVCVCVCVCMCVCVRTCVCVCVSDTGLCLFEDIIKHLYIRYCLSVLPSQNYYYLVLFISNPNLLLLNDVNQTWISE